MSTIYKNTIAGLGLGAAFSLIKGGAATPTTYALPAIAVINAIDIVINKGYSKKESISPKKVFYSPTQQNMTDCNYKHKEFNYIDLGTKALSIGLAVAELSVNKLQNYDFHLSLLPACVAVIGETASELYGFDGYKSIETKCTDAYGTYIECEL